MKSLRQVFSVVHRKNLRGGSRMIQSRLGRIRGYFWEVVVAEDSHSEIRQMPSVMRAWKRPSGLEQTSRGALRAPSPTTDWWVCCSDVTDMAIVRSSCVLRLDERLPPH